MYGSFDVIRRSFEVSIGILFDDDPWAQWVNLFSKFLKTQRPSYCSTAALPSSTMAQPFGLAVGWGNPIGRCSPRKCRPDLKSWQKFGYMSRCLSRSLTFTEDFLGSGTHPRYSQVGYIPSHVIHLYPCHDAQLQLNPIQALLLLPLAILEKSHSFGQWGPKQSRHNTKATKTRVVWGPNWFLYIFIIEMM